MNLTAYRRITQVSFILFIFLMPVFNIFRYDTATHELILFGNVWSLGLKQGFYADQSAIGALHIALQFFLKAILPWLVFLALFPLLGYFTGRFFCGWLCPEGALFELSDFLTLRLLGRRSLYSKKPNDPDIPRENRLRYVDHRSAEHRRDSSRRRCCTHRLSRGAENHLAPDHDVALHLRRKGRDHRRRDLHAHHLDPRTPRAVQVHLRSRAHADALRLDQPLVPQAPYGHRADIEMH